MIAHPRTFDPLHVEGLLASGAKASNPMPHTVSYGAASATMYGVVPRMKSATPSSAFALAWTTAKAT